MLREFITSHDFAFALILASLDAASQDDAQLLSAPTCPSPTHNHADMISLIHRRTPHQHIVPPSITSTPTLPSQLSRLTHLLPTLRLHITDPTIPSESNLPYPPFLPAGGLTRRLLASLHDEPKPVSHGAITAWCVEGDNRGDAHEFARVVLEVLGLGEWRLFNTRDVLKGVVDGTTVQEPRSWAGLFGAKEGWSGGMGADAELYG